MRLMNVDAPLLWRKSTIRDHGIFSKRDSGTSTSFHANVETRHCCENISLVNFPFAEPELRCGNSKSTCTVKRDSRYYFHEVMVEESQILRFFGQINDYTRLNSSGISVRSLLKLKAKALANLVVPFFRTLD